MFKRIIICTMLLAASPLAAHAGEGTIRETDEAIIIEYSGEGDNDVKAFKNARELDEKQSTVDADRQKSKIEQSLEKKAAKEAAQNAPGASREEPKVEE